jgi:hypothetical protein
VSLLDPLELLASDFCRLGQNLSLMYVALMRDEIWGTDPGEHSMDFWPTHEATLSQCEKYCRALGLDISAKNAADLLQRVQARDLKKHDALNLLQTIERELTGRVFLSVPYDRCKAFSKPLEGWQHLLDVFPDAQEDIEEMNKCYALSRYTAAVFHSLLVVEHGLIRLGHYIGVTDPKLGWDATYKRLSWLLNNRASVPPDLDFNFLEQTKARLDSMKLAWRNKVNHAAGKLQIEKTGFTDFAAEEVIIACRSFMRHLAEGLP